VIIPRARANFKKERHLETFHANQCYIREFMEPLLTNTWLFCKFPAMGGWVNSFDNDREEVTTAVTNV